MSLYGLKKQLVIHPSTSFQPQPPKTSDHCIVADIQSSKKEEMPSKSIHMDDDVTYKNHVSNKSIIMQENLENFTITNQPVGRVELFNLQQFQEDRSYLCEVDRRNPMMP